MNLREMLKALIAEARTIGEKAVAEGRDFTEAEADRVAEIQTEKKSLEERIQKADAAREAVKAITAGMEQEQQGKGHVTPDQQVLGGGKGEQRMEIKDRQPSFESLGEAFTKSESYQNFLKAYPSGVGQGSRIELGRTQLGDFKSFFSGQKADLLTTDIARIQPTRYPTINMIDRQRLTLLDLISRGTMAGAFEYVQITGVNRGAGIVEEATGAKDVDGTDLDPLKPTSDFETALADAKPYTYADGYEVTNQLLSDAPAFATYLNTELGYSIQRVIENGLLNGTGTDGQPKGLLNTSGVQQQPISGDMVKTIRKAMTRVTRIGGPVNGVLMSPEHDEAWDLLQDNEGRYMGAGPFQSGPATAWGRPRITSELLSGKNIAILGDFSTIALLDREGLSIEAFNQHKDFAQRNKVYVRAELRAGQVIWRPNRLVVVQLPDPTA